MSNMQVENRQDMHRQGMNRQDMSVLGENVRGDLRATFNGCESPQLLPDCQTASIPHYER